MRRATRFCWGLAVVLLAALGGCNYFSPAQPESPTGGASFLPDYNSPDSTLATVAKAVGDKGRSVGASAYGGAFAESVTTASPAGFHAFFWPADLAEWSQLTGHQAPNDWGFDLELSFYSRFLRLRPDGYHVEWNEDVLNPDNIASETATIHRHYLVTSFAADGTQTSVLAVGFADLTLLRFSDGNWRIVRWDDRRDSKADPALLTWGRQRLNTQ